MSSYSQNPSFSGIRQPRSFEPVSLISKNVKTGFLTVSGNSTLKGTLDVTGLSTLSGGVKVGAGSNLYKVAVGTVSVNPGSIAATTRGSVAVTISGLATGDRVILQPPSTLDGNLLFVGSDVTADNTLTIYLYNKSGGAIDDAAASWKYSSLTFTSA